ncbi:unnamed protein product, partial [Staurois parvus]
MEGRTGTHERLWTWQQPEEAVQGPMTDYGPGSSMRRRYGGTAAMGGRTGTHDTLWTWQQH